MEQAAIDPARLLAPLGPARFFAEYWQRRMLSLMLAAEDFARILAAVGPLDVARLAGLAREGARAWLANDFVAHSVIPVDASNAAAFFDIGATLYFTNVALPQLTEPLADFLGAPRQKLLASLFLTPAGGGAVPHFDKNENFTIQLTGAKRWHVAEAPSVPAAPDGYVLGQPPVASLGMAPIADPPRRMVELVPGSLLYVPRGTIHATDAGAASWSLNLSYSPSMWLDLVRVALRRRLAGSERWRGIVTGAGPAADPGARAENILPALAAELRALLDDPRELERLAGDFLEQPYD